MDTITIKDQEVFFRVGVPDEERAKPQRLLISVAIEHDLRKAARTDDIVATINYYAVTQRILALGENRSWRLIETLANDVAHEIIKHFAVGAVTVEIKKFIIPGTRHVAVSLRRTSRNTLGSDGGT